jgi:Methyltransferase domain
MLSNFKVVCVAFVANGPTLEMVSSRVLGTTWIDEYQLWPSSPDCDLTYAQRLAGRDCRVSIRRAAIHARTPRWMVFSACREADTIYVYFDRDLVFVESDLVEKLVKFRIQHADPLLVSANVLNNPLCTYLQSINGSIDPGTRVHPWGEDGVPRSNGRLVEQLHRYFLRSVTAGSVAKFYFGVQQIAVVKFSIDCATWFGKDLMDLPHHCCDEEEVLTVRYPCTIRRANCVYGDAIACRYATDTQRAHLEQTNILEQYRAISCVSSPGRGRGGRNPQDTALTEDNNIWSSRLLETVNAIGRAPLADLQSPNVIADLIRHAGLVRDHRQLYGPEERFVNAGNDGLWQIPMQLALCLAELSEFDIKSFLEIGTWSGWTTSFIAAYLRRFNPSVHAVTVDTGDAFDFANRFGRILGIECRRGRAIDFRDERFDLVFIDADHSYKSCRQDYEAVGRRASLCMFHDVNDKYVRGWGPNEGGVPRFWSELKSSIAAPDAVLEFVDHPTGDSVMGLGLVIRGDARHRA